MIFILLLINTATAEDSNNTIEQNNTLTATNIEKNIIINKTIPKTNTESTQETDNKTTNNDDDKKPGEGCCSTIIQGYNNDSSISFRRDATNTLTVYVKHDNSIIKQYKDGGSYFFHVIVSKDGWMVGNGGADNVQVNRAIENNALSMINKNIISKTTMNTIASWESKLSVGHFVIKAPNGTYSLIIKGQKRTYRESGVLRQGQYLVVPNNPSYFQKGSVNNIKTESTMITTSWLLTAKDRYGISRREIITYYYKNNIINSTVKIQVTNDNGKYVGRSTSRFIDNIATNTKYFSAKSIPIIDKSIAIDTVNFILRKAKTIVTSQNININGDVLQLKAVVKDEFGNNVNEGYVGFYVDDKLVKNSNGKVIQISVKNATATYWYRLPNIWKQKNHTYYAIYYANQQYDTKIGNKAKINIQDIIKLNTKHSKETFYEGNLSITTNINYLQNNSVVNGGKVFYKINGKTIINSLGNTITIDAINGTTSLNVHYNTKYSARTYTLTTIYINGVYRKEINTTFMIKKILTKIITPKILVKNNQVSITGKLVDNKNSPIKYSSYAIIKINGKTLMENNASRKFTITNGVINFNFTLHGKYKVGNHTITIVVPELRETMSVRNNYQMKISWFF